MATAREAFRIAYRLMRMFKKDHERAEIYADAVWHDIEMISAAAKLRFSSRYKGGAECVATATAENFDRRHAIIANLRFARRRRLNRTLYGHDYPATKFPKGKL